MVHSEHTKRDFCIQRFCYHVVFLHKVWNRIIQYTKKCNVKLNMFIVISAALCASFRSFCSEKFQICLKTFIRIHCLVPLKRFFYFVDNIYIVHLKIVFLCQKKIHLKFKPARNRVQNVSLIFENKKKKNYNKNSFRENQNKNCKIFGIFYTSFWVWLKASFHFIW